MPKPRTILVLICEVCNEPIGFLSHHEPLLLECEEITCPVCDQISPITDDLRKYLKSYNNS